MSIAALGDSGEPPSRRRSTSAVGRRCIGALRYTLFQLRSAPIYPRRLEGGFPSQLRPLKTLKSLKPLRLERLEREIKNGPYCARHRSTPAA